MISLLCAVKDRKDHLLRSLPSWSDVADEIIIVDWGSEEPVSALIEVKQNEKVKTVQVNKNHAKFWTFSQSYNTAARFASGEYYIVMNADEIVIDSKSISSLERPNSEFFYEGTDWASDDAHGVYFLYIAKNEFWKINGYHEDIIGYGYDDVDLRNRLQESGLRLKVSGAKIKHIKHESRHETRENALNCQIAMSFPWSVNERLIDLDFRDEGKIIYCDIGMRDRIQPHEMVVRNIKAAELKDSVIVE